MTSQPPPPLSASQPPAATTRRRRWLLLGVAALLLAGGAAGAWWWRSRPATTAPTPPMPGDIQDAEIRQALDYARRQVLDKPGSALAWGTLGMLLLTHGFEVDADRCFAEAAHLDSTDPRWPYARGLIALKRDPDNVLPFLRRAAATADARPEYRSVTRLRLAETLLERRELDEAEGLFREEERRQGDNPRAALGLGLVAVARGDEQAAHWLSLPAVRDSRFARKKALAQLAALAWDRGDKKAATDYEQATATLPDDPPWPDPFLAEVGRLQVGRRSRERQVTQMEEQEHYAEAAQAYLQQIEEQPTTRAYVGAGINLAHLGQYDQALRWLREAVRRDPNSIQAQYTLAMTLFSRAEEEWQRSPGSPQAKEWFRETVEHAQRATQLKPDHSHAYLIWGVSLKYLGELTAAIAPLRNGVTSRPVDFDLQFALGEVLLEAGQYQEAQTYLENARQLDPNDPRVVQALKELHKKKD